MNSRRILLLALVCAFVQFTFDAFAAATPNIVGTWKLVSTKYGNATEHKKYGGGSTRLKIINPTHFTWVEVGGSGHVESSAGGKYTLVGDTYTESIEFAGSGMESYLGKPQKFTVRVDGNKLTLAGELSDGLKIEEVWDRVK